MKNSFVITFKTLVYICCWIPISLSLAVPSETLSTPDLIKALQSGGHIIYMRHANTDRTQMDTDGDTFDDCDNQRNLSAEGREQAKRIGLIIQKLRIPIGTVLSSPYCRTKETAKLAFGQFGVVSKLQYSFTKNSEEFKRLGADLLTMMKKTEAEEKNDVFVGHSANLKDGLGVWPKPEGVLVVFKKSGEDIIFKGMIQPDEWPK